MVVRGAASVPGGVSPTDGGLWAPPARPSVIRRLAVGPGTVSVAGGPLGIAARWSRLLIIAAVLLSTGQFGLPTVTAPVVLVVAGLGLVAGIPHGAADHVIATQLAAGRPMPLVVAAYAGAAAAAWALLQWGGAVALLGVVALSALHFGLGELEVSHQLTGWQPSRVVAVSLVVAGSGALILPLARAGDQLTAVATAVSPALAQLIGGPTVQIGLVVTWLVAALVAVIASLWSGHPTVALDVVLLGALGILVPPLLAFALWFGGWHALRHDARILTVEPGCAALVTTGRQRAAVLRLIRLAAVPSIAALTAVAALAWLTVTASDPTAVVAEVLRLLLALTVPHMLVVLWVDRTARQDSTMISQRGQPASSRMAG
ncbi:beta-carotene 15,15'-dioxygenase, Brp/Blh family [Mycobacterium sp.]|uniref:beta-carotene 15,15'-dioxygenase, Brp/Blh family n=1 Tax=Mycobacterium sp. TaxID=1785 RepID=UPI003D0D1A28